ncbi:hypothetical protein [Paeniglutamicibacter kerguelensis]|uniref:Membrane associated rhomboid family serine protease n=1 Tax=Paeniglutamicibacter kerguelensis TaxID=254788 RepID=A0ABS4XA25_9MICC|nr:hypothetical protein [Paeniglutamicibacter kerguelensis]MBP2385218.1 membrane associated rhomboid family serine protease [Paeniglutamicibacter kerguelensis]
MGSMEQTAGKSKQPVATWTLMAAALAITLLLPDWAGSGSPRSPWLLASPAVLGLAGAFLAARQDSPGWMVASGVWGIALIPALIFIVTLVGGP